MRGPPDGCEWRNQTRQEGRCAARQHGDSCVGPALVEGGAVEAEAEATYQCRVLTCI